MVLPLLVEPAIGEDAHIPGFTRYGSFLNGFLGVETQRSKSHRSTRFTDHPSAPSTKRSTTKEGYSNYSTRSSAPSTRSTTNEDDSESAVAYSSATFTPSVGRPKSYDTESSPAPFVPQALAETATDRASEATRFVVAPPMTPRNVSAPTDLRRYSIGSTRPVDPGHVTGNEHPDKRAQRNRFRSNPLPSLSTQGEQESEDDPAPASSRSLPLSARRNQTLTLSILGEKESDAVSAPTSSRSFPPSVRRRHTMLVSIPGEQESDADPSPTSSRSFPLSARRRHSVNTMSGRASDELVASALSHRRGSKIGNVNSIPENPSLGRRKSRSEISDTSLSPKGLRLDYDERVKRQACKYLRIIMFGSVGNEDWRQSERDLIYEQNCGSAAEVRNLFELWSDLDPEASWEVTMDLVLASLKMQCAEDDGRRAERCGRYLMDVIQHRNAAGYAAQSSSSGSYGSQICTPEDLMRILWLAADENDIRLMNQRMQLRYLTRMRVPPPPLLSADKLHEIAEEFRHLDQRGSGHIRYDDLLTAGFVDECTMKGLQARYDDGSGVLELSQFIDMRCPCGFRATAETERAQQQDGEFVSFVTTAELPTGHFSGWMLDKTIKRLPMGLKSLLNAKAFSVFASCTTRGLIQTTFAAWRALSIKDDALEGYSSGTSTSTSSFSSDDEG